MCLVDVQKRDRAKMRLYQRLRFRQSTWDEKMIGGDPTCLFRTRWVRWPPGPKPAQKLFLTSGREVRLLASMSSKRPKVALVGLPSHHEMVPEHVRDLVKEHLEKLGPAMEEAG